MDLLDSFHTGTSGSYDVALTINNLRGTMVGGTTLYSRYKVGSYTTDSSTIYSEFDYKTAKYTVPEMVTETDRYFYLGAGCEGNTSGQVLKTDCAVCQYILKLTDLPTIFSDLLKNFFIENLTTHYSDGTRS
ncbi:hypothetical protein [Caproiciproducens sp.]